jgi:hypothetical protein
MSDSWPSSVDDEPSDSISARAVEIERALRTLEAVEAFRAEAAALRAELQAARAPLARRPYRRRAPTPDLPEGTWRLILEAALIVAVAVVVWAVGLHRRDIVLTMVGAWVLVALVEAIASRRSELRWSPPPPPVQPVAAAPPVPVPEPPEEVFLPPLLPPEPEPEWPVRPDVVPAYATPEPARPPEPEPEPDPEPVTIVRPPLPPRPEPEPEPEPAAGPEPAAELAEEPLEDDEPELEPEPEVAAPRRRLFWSRTRPVMRVDAGIEPEPEDELEAWAAEAEPEPVVAVAAPEQADDWPDDLDDGHLVGAVAALEEAALRLEEAVMETPEVRRRWGLRRRRERSRR